MGFWKSILGSNEDSGAKKLQPEDFYITEITDKTIKVLHPKRETEEIDWDEIEEIEIITTDEGPFLPDVWLVLTGKNNKGCSIPQGSAGWTKVYDIVSKYEGFNFEKVIESASSTENKVFDIWKKI